MIEIDPVLIILKILIRVAHKSWNGKVTNCGMEMSQIAEWILNNRGVGGIVAIGMVSYRWRVVTSWCIVGMKKGKAVWTVLRDALGWGV